MNERSRELAEQAWDHLIDEMGDSLYDRTGNFSTKFLLAYDQRFAELIVRECAEFVSAGEFGDPGTARELKQYFGVK